MVIQLLRLDKDTLINPDKIVQITIQNLTKLFQERRQNHLSVEQLSRMDDKVWQVSVYIASGNDGYNPQRYTQNFQTLAQAQAWITSKFSAVIVNQL